MQISMNCIFFMNSCKCKSYISNNLYSFFPILPPTLIGDESLDDVINACKTEVKKIIESCRANNTKFTDASFPTNDECLFRDPANPPKDWIKPKQYLRITDICTNPLLFSSGITPDDVDQGAIGTCYLLGDLSGIALYPHLITQLFVEYDVEMGVYGLRFFINSRWQYIIIDDYIACNENRRPVYGCCTDRNEIWVMLIEKAYAKLHSCYENINGGLERLAFSDLTGGVAQRAVVPKGLKLNPDGTTVPITPLNSATILIDDSLSGVEQAGFSSATFGTWNAVIHFSSDATVIQELELVLSFASGKVEGGGKNITTGTQYTLEGSTDARTQYVWFVLKEVIYLPTTRPKPLLFMGVYNGDSLSIKGDWMQFDLAESGRFVLVENVDPSSNLSNRIGPFSSIWHILNIKHKEHVLMSCSIDDINAAIEEKMPSGLLKNHAYSLISFHKLEKELLLVKLRNPHGRAGWKGKWRKGGPEWTSEMIKKVPDYDPKENGEFYVDFQTFLTTFNSIDMCRLFTDDWNLQMRDCEFTPLMCGGDLFWLENPQIRITPQARGKFVINVSQPDVKIYSGEDLYPIPIGFRVLYFPYPTDRVREATGALVVCHVPPTSEKSVSIEIELDALDQPYFVVPYTAEPGKFLPFQISVYGTVEFELSDMSYMEDPSCHPIPSGIWKGELATIGTNAMQELTMDMYFDAPRGIINGVGSDATGKYFVYGNFKHKSEDEYTTEFQLTYLQLRSMEKPPEPFYMKGTWSKNDEAITGFMLVDKGDNTENCLVRLAPLPNIAPPSGFYEGYMTFNEEQLPAVINSLIFKNNRVYGRDYDTNYALNWYSLQGEVYPDNTITICQMHHFGSEFMYFGQLAEDLQSFSGKIRGVFAGNFLEGEFELHFNEEKTKEYTPESQEDHDFDPLTEWYLNERFYEVVEYFTYDTLPEQDKKKLQAELAAVVLTRKHYEDRVGKHAKTNDDISYTRKEMAHLGRNVMSSFGRAEMARMGRNEMARHGRNEMARHGRNEMARFGRNEMARHGRNEMSRYGRSEMARFGRSEMARFGRSEMARFGRSEMARFGRKEMTRHGRKVRNDEEYDQRAREREAVQEASVDEGSGSEYLSKQVKRLEELLQEEQRKSELKLSAMQQKYEEQIQQLQQKSEDQKLSKSPSLKRGPLPKIEERSKSPQPQDDLVKEYEAKLQRERERVRVLEEKLSQLGPTTTTISTKEIGPIPSTSGTKNGKFWGSVLPGKGRKIVLPQIKQ